MGKSRIKINWKRIISIILLTIIGILFTMIVFAKPIPYYDFVMEVYNTPYNIFTENCSHKALKVHNFFVSRELQSRLVVGKIIYVKKPFIYHAWVEVVYRGEWIVVDATDYPSDWGLTPKECYWLKPLRYYYGILTRRQIR